MFTYYAYGLGIHSDLPLPEFVAAKVKKDISIRLDRYEYLPVEAKEKQSYIKITSEVAIISDDEIGTFLIRRGKEIIINPKPKVDIRILRRYLVGTIMGILLYQRGLLVLHASSVSVNGSAIAFLGASGSGKSSLAAAFHRRGYDIISDDITAVDVKHNSFKVFPGFPQLNLNFQTAESLGYNPDTRIMLGEFDEKHGFRFEDDFIIDTLTLSRIYVLDEDIQYRIERLSSQNAFIELVRHSFPTRLIQPDEIAHFSRCVKLAKGIPHFHLYRAFTSNNVQSVAQIVEEHLSSSNSA